MNLIDFDPIADFLAEDPIERLGVMSFGISSWLVAVVQAPPQGLLQSLIQVVPPILGLWVAHRLMERAHELRMEKMRQSKEKPQFIAFGAKPGKPGDDTVDVP